MTKPRKGAAPVAPRRTSGPTQLESERRHRQVKLRLDPSTEARLRALAAQHDVTISTLVALCVALAERSGSLAASLAMVDRAAGAGAGAPRGVLLPCPRGAGRRG